MYSNRMEYVRRSEMLILVVYVLILKVCVNTWLCIYMALVNQERECSNLKQNKENTFPWVNKGEWNRNRVKEENEIISATIMVSGFCHDNDICCHGSCAMGPQSAHHCTAWGTRLNNHHCYGNAKSGIWVTGDKIWYDMKSYTDVLTNVLSSII